MKRIYTVTDGKTTPRLVRAASQSQALGHVARATFTVRVATQEQLVTNLQTGVQVEEARSRTTNQRKPSMNAIVKQESTGLTEIRPQFDLSPQTFEQALTFANYLAESDMVPKDFKGKPGNCLIAMQWGNELGMKAIQAIQNIAVINGRPALWGDAVIALVRSSPVCEYIIETEDATSSTCRVKRRGEQEQSRTFSDDDAKAAGLLGKQGPWTNYKKRMRQMRARAFALRDVFPDVLRGLPVAEEVMDAPKDMGRADVVEPPALSAELRTAALEAAAKGKKAFAAWIKIRTETERAALSPLRPEFEAAWNQADAARTVEPTARAAQPQDVVTLEMVLGKLRAAANMDALDVALDWANTLSDPQEIKQAEALYGERKAAIGG